MYKQTFNNLTLILSQKWSWRTINDNVIVSGDGLLWREIIITKMSTFSNTAKIVKPDKSWLVGRRVNGAAYAATCDTVQ